MNPTKVKISLLERLRKCTYHIGKAFRCLFGSFSEINVSLDDQTLLSVMIEAHQKDITLNEWMAKAILKICRELKVDING